MVLRASCEYSVGVSVRCTTSISASRTIRGLAACGSWQKMQLSEWFDALASSTTFDVRLHLAPGTGSPMYAQSRMWSCVLQDRHTGFAAAAVPGLNAFWSALSGYWSTTTSDTLKSPEPAR